MAEFKERRKYIRFYNTDISFKTKEISQAGAPAAQAVAVNMNAEGICFTSGYKLMPGTKIELDIAIPFRPKPTYLEGEIRWCNPVKTEDGREMFNTGVRLFISKTNEAIFLIHVCDRMQQRIKELEEALKESSKKVS